MIVPKDYKFMNWIFWHLKFNVEGKIQKFNHRLGKYINT